MSDKLRLLQVNPTMASGELHPFLVQPLPLHLSLSSKYIGNFCAKAIKYLSGNGLKQIVDEVASQLLSSTTTEEHIASDLSIDKREMQKLLLNIMGKGDFCDVLKFFNTTKQ